MTDKYISKIALGTVQFGMDYGINNKRGVVPEEEVFNILDLAYEKGVDTLDTAYSYGQSEQVLGRYLSKNPGRFNVISKLPECGADEVSGYFELSLKRLGVTSLYGYLLHDFNIYRKDSDTWLALKDLKGEGKIKKIGFSLYYPEELEEIFNNNLSIDLIQIPYSVFDQRFSGFFPVLREKGIELHVRSVFLQGLVFKKPEELDDFFFPLREKLLKLREVSSEMNIPVAAVCLNFVTNNHHVDKVVVGIDDENNFEENINSLKMLGKVKSVYDELKALHEDDELIILPFNWTK